MSFSVEDYEERKALLRRAIDADDGQAFIRALLDEPEPERRLDQGFAVFNLHVNSAGARADEEYTAQYGKESYEKHIAPIRERVMKVFEQPVTMERMAWVTLVTAYVNEDRS